jgi:hypothetical protein
LLDELVDKYAWTTEDLDFVWTVAVIEGKSRDEVIRIYGGDPGSSVGDYYFAQLADLQGPGDPLKFHVQVFTQGSYVLAVEENGWTGSMPEIARRCSGGGGHFFSVYWNINGLNYTVQAHDGKVVAFFELFIGDQPIADGDLVPPWIAERFIVKMGKRRETQMALMEQQTGLEFDRRWLSELRPTYRIPDPDWMLRDVEDARKVY